MSCDVGDFSVPTAVACMSSWCRGGAQCVSNSNSFPWCSVDTSGVLIPVECNLRVHSKISDWILQGRCCVCKVSTEWMWLWNDYLALGHSKEWLIVARILTVSEHKAGYPYVGNLSISQPTNRLTTSPAHVYRVCFLGVTTLVLMAGNVITIAYLPDLCTDGVVTCCLKQLGSI